METEVLEYKKSLSELKEALASISAILNKHQKGKLIFGVRPNGVVVGQEVNSKTLRDVSKTISDHIEPKIYPKIEKQKIKGKDCIVIEFQGDQIPYYAYGRAYKRVADEDKKMTAKELETMILDNNRDKLRWDTELCKEAKLADISSKKLKEFLRKSEKSFDGVESSLRKLSLMKGNKLSNAAVILFGRKPEKFFPNARLRCALFGTDDTSVTLDMQEFYGDLFFLIGQAQNYILKNIHVGMKLEGMRRIDVPEISIDAIREGIINAFCHRDYWKYDSVNVAVFRNRVEIRSPGLLYGGLTLERIRKENVSERRNELIAEMFHLVHFVEKWGRGIGLILSKEPATEFKEVGTQFVTVFRRKGDAPQKTPQKTPQKPTKLERKILVFISKNISSTREEIAERLSLSSETVKEYIAKLKKKGLLNRIGPDKGGHWEVCDGK